MVTPKGTLSPVEAKKSLRDALIFSVAYAIPEIIEVLKVWDFGEYTTSVSLALAVIAPLINRYLSLYRIK
jgi:hypothetical protein